MTKKSPPSRSHGRKTIRPTLKPRELMDPEAELARAWRAQVITLFPEAFPGTLGLSLTGKALKDGLWQLNTVPLRAFGEGKHRNVDDTPAGGGAGMVLRPDVMGAAIETADIALMTDDLGKVPWLIGHSRRTTSTDSHAERTAELSPVHPPDRRSGWQGHFHRVQPRPSQAPDRALLGVHPRQRSRLLPSSRR